jgi:hypothetical protein
MLKADLSFKMVDAPPDGMCKSGHKGREGVRFFKVGGPALHPDRWGTYCEDCMTAANKLARKRKGAANKAAVERVSERTRPAKSSEVAAVTDAWDLSDIATADPDEV